MAMRVPERAEVSQEARLLLARQSLPDILDRGTQAVDDLPPLSAISQAMRIDAASRDTRLE